MFLGVWWNPFSWGSDILDGIVSFFYGILLSIDCIIYSFVSYIYQIFLVLAQGGKIIDDKFIGDLVNRIYIIIGVVMLFLIAYSLLRSMINLDDLKGKKSPVNIVKDVIISVVLIALLPTIFEFAFDFQNSLLINNTIGKLIVGTSSSGDPATTISDGGYTMASTVFHAFLHENPEECDESSTKSECKELADTWQESESKKSLWVLASLGPDIVDGYVNYYILISPAAGVFVILVLLSYCLDMAIRLIKLAVYEVIAPIPIFARIIPHDKAKQVFSNWVKATLSTFAEVFIRIALLYFIVLLIDVVVSSIDNIFSPLVSGSARIDILLFAEALIVIGLVMFIKQAPDIIKEITGLDGGKYNVFGSAMKAASAIGGLATAGVNNWNNKDDDGNEKKPGRRLASALAGGGSALFRSINNRDNVKDPKSLKENAHNVAEAAIKKRIERENKAKERDDYLKSKGEVGMNDRSFGEKIQGAYKYKAHTLHDKAEEWAGAGEYSAVKSSRTQEFADKVDSGFSSLEGTWKKTQAFIDAKADTEKLKNEYEFARDRREEDIMLQEQKLLRDILERINKKEAEKPLAERLTDEQRMAAAKAEAHQTAVATVDTSIADAQRKFAQADYNKTQIQLSEQAKKAESIASSARNIQLSMQQYSDVKLDIKAAMERESDPAKRAAMEKAFEMYGGLDDPAKYKQLVDDIKAKKAEAQDFIDALDKINLEAQENKRQAAYQEQARKSTTSSSSGSGDKK